VLTHPVTNRPACGLYTVDTRVGASWVSLRATPLRSCNCGWARVSTQ